MSSTDTRICHIHETVILANDPCPDCLAWYSGLPDPATMTPEQRVAEMKQWRGPLQVEFDDLHKRLEALVGRPVWTHEMGLSFDGLIEEARARTGELDMGKVLSVIPEDKAVIAVAIETDH